VRYACVGVDQRLEEVTTVGMYASLFAVPESLVDEMRRDAATREEWLGDPSELDTHQLDKLWHGLHYLMTGSDQPTNAPVGHAIFGGAALSEDDMGFGPATYLTPAEVAVAAVAMKQLDAKDLRARFDPADMSARGVYPDIWVREGEAALDDLLAAYEKLRSYYARAADKGLAMLMWIA
jgi:hypothetical protein